MKRFYNFLLIVLLLLCLSVSVAAQTSFIDDSAGLLTSSQESYLQQRIQEITQEHSFHAVILTVDSLQGQTPKSFAESYFLSNGFGVGESKDGILFLLALNSRDWYMATHGNTRDVITDGDIDEIADEILGDLSSGNYFEAFGSWLNEIEEEYEYEQTSWLRNLLIALAIGAVIAGIALFFMRRAMNTARSQSGAGDYLKDGSFDLYECRDFYLYSRTTKVRKSQNTSSGSRSGGSSFGGRGGKF